VSVTHGYAFYRPSLWLRLTLALGFRQAWAQVPQDEDDSAEWAPGSFTSNTVVTLGWRDWLRLLVSRRLFVSTTSKTDVVVKEAKTWSAANVLPPGWKGEP